MPKATVVDEPRWSLPKETPLKARLDKVEDKTIRWKKDGEQKERDLWVWEFKIIEGDYEGLRAWGETDAKISNRPDNKPRQWSEALTGIEFQIGDGFDSDDLLGLECVITVDNIERAKPDGGTFYGCPVLDVYPVEMWDALRGEPGF